ncbi:MAG: hypothetical protein ACXWF4_07060, partial [Candidatus Aminicenantales bacterium]
MPRRDGQMDLGPERERNGPLPRRQRLLEIGRGRIDILQNGVHDFRPDHGRREAFEEIAVRIGGDLVINVDDAQGALVPGRLHPRPVLVVGLISLVVLVRGAAVTEDELALDLEAGVVVIADLRARDAPTGEDRFGCPVAAVGVEKGQEILLRDELHLFIGRGLGRVGRAVGKQDGHLGLVDDRIGRGIGLKVTVLARDGLEAPSGELFRGPLGGGGVARVAGQAPGVFRLGQGLDDVVGFSRAYGCQPVPEVLV